MGDRAMSGEPLPDRAAGSGLYKLSRAICGRELFESAVTPTLADLQYEVESAGPDRTRRWIAYLRGCAGLSRVLINQVMTGRMLMRRWAAVLILGAIGAALLVAASSLKGDLMARIGQIEVAPFFLMAIATPVVLRKLGLGAGFRQMFMNCVSVGVMMGGAFIIGSLYFVGPQLPPWYLLASRFAILMGFVLFGSALAATIGTDRRGEGQSRFRLAMRGLVWSAGAFGMAYIVLQSFGLIFTARPLTFTIGIQVAVAILTWAALLSFFFSAVVAAVYCPLVLASRRLSAGRLWPTVIGALLFPIPWEIYALVKADPHLHLLSMMGNPWIALAKLFLPLVIGGAVFGWTLANREERPADRKPLQSATTA
ncbi:MAG: hypothetical protein NT151_08800 [Acidobacteria bacterium]|nr:hypothetical protein [Acidobacteriota bacterium]